MYTSLIQIALLLVICLLLFRIYQSLTSYFMVMAKRGDLPGGLYPVYSKMEVDAFERARQLGNAGMMEATNTIHIGNDWIDAQLAAGRSESSIMQSVRRYYEFMVQWETACEDLNNAIQANIDVLNGKETLKKAISQKYSYLSPQVTFSEEIQKKEEYLDDMRAKVKERLARLG